MRLLLIIEVNNTEGWKQEGTVLHANHLTTAYSTQVTTGNEYLQKHTHIRHRTPPLEGLDSVGWAEVF